MKIRKNLGREMWDFQEDDFREVNSKLCVHGLTLFMSEYLHPQIPEYVACYHGDPALMAKLLQLPRAEFWSEVQELPLPYFSLSERITEETRPATAEYIQHDMQDREFLLSKATSKRSPYWWCFLHECEGLAAFFLLPLFRRLTHALAGNLYFYGDSAHSFIVWAPEGTTQEAVVEFLARNDVQRTHTWTSIVRIDLISWCLNLAPENFFKSYAVQNLIPLAQVMTWYCSNFSYQGMKFQDFADFNATLSSSE